MGFTRGVLYCAKFEAVTAVLGKSQSFYHTTPRKLVYRHQRFGGTCCLRLQTGTTRARHIGPLLQSPLLAFFCVIYPLFLAMLCIELRCRWKKQASPKHEYVCANLHVVISQKSRMFDSYTVRKLLVLGYIT